MVKQFTCASTALAALLLAGAAYGDTLFGIYAGAGVWQQGYSGGAASGAGEVSVENDLDLDDSNNNMLYVAMEHGVPVLPNLRASYSDISTSGANLLDRDVSFHGKQFDASTNVTSDLELMQADAVAYYEVLDNVVSMDLGIAARWVDGRVQVASDSAVGRADFKGVLPLLYARARADLPFSGLWIGAEAMGVAYDGNHIFDANAQVGWESRLGLGAELGWRTFRLELEGFDEIDRARIDVAGPYAAVNFHF